MEQNQSEFVEKTKNNEGKKENKASFCRAYKTFST